MSNPSKQTCCCSSGRLQAPTPADARNWNGRYALSVAALAILWWLAQPWWAPMLASSCMAGVLLWLNQRMRGNVVFALAASWALAAVYVKQSGWRLPGSDTAALVAVVMALVLTAQTVWLRLRPQPRPALG